MRQRRNSRHAVCACTKNNVERLDGSNLIGKGNVRDVRAKAGSGSRLALRSNGDRLNETTELGDGRRGLLLPVRCDRQAEKKRGDDEKLSQITAPQKLANLMRSLFPLSL